MQVINHTHYQAAASPGLLPSGRYCLVLVIKGTWEIPTHPPGPLPLAVAQSEPHDADAFLGKPGYSSLLYENDFATEKPKCDVLLINPIAYPPGGEPAPQVEVALRIGEIEKRVRVLGRRYWQGHEETLGVSEPEPFISQPLSWEIAYGGVDESAYEEPELSDAYRANPVGIGYRKNADNKALAGTPIAQTEALDAPITSPEQRPEPQGFGPIARSWHPRSGYGGTYDEAWVKNDKPFLPKDFDPRFYQCAPEDQQIDYPQGGEQVQLSNLSAEGALAFALPTLDVPVSLVLANGDTESLTTCIDTITLDAQARTLTLVARARYALKNSIHEVSHFVVGEAPQAESEDADEEDWDELWDEEIDEV